MNKLNVIMSVPVTLTRMHLFSRGVGATELAISYAHFPLQVNFIRITVLLRLNTQFKPPSRG